MIPATLTGMLTKPPFSRKQYRIQSALSSRTLSSSPQKSESVPVCVALPKAFSVVSVGFLVFGETKAVLLHY
jgi:hypothetical protein